MWFARIRRVLCRAIPSGLTHHCKPQFVSTDYHRTKLTGERPPPLGRHLTVEKQVDNNLSINMPVSITQETFDEVVKENMEDFDMDRDAAVQDAIEQFEKQGQFNEHSDAHQARLLSCAYLVV